LIDVDGMYSGDPNGGGNQYELQTDYIDNYNAEQNAKEGAYKQSQSQRAWAGWQQMYGGVGASSATSSSVGPMLASTDPVSIFTGASNSTGWSPLYKSQLAQYYQQMIGSPGNANQLGAMFEDIFEEYVSSSVSLIPAQITKNTGLFSGGDRNTVPDFTGNAFYIDRTNAFKSRFIRGASWFELKAKNGGLYLSSNIYQLRGHIDNLARIFRTQMNEISGFRPGLFLVTTADVPLSLGVAAYAAEKNIAYFHYHAQFQIVNNVWHFRFQ